MLQMYNSSSRLPCLWGANMHKILNKCHPLVFRDAGHQAIVQDSSETATLYTINFDQLCTFYEYYMLWTCLDTDPNQDQPRTSAAECPILPDGIKTKFPGCGSWAAFWDFSDRKVRNEGLWVHLSSSEFCVSSSMSQSIILTTGPKARNGKTKLASCRAELPRAESPFLAAGPCTSSTRLSPQPETIRNHFMSERCKCIANTLRCSLWLSWIQELGWQYWESKAFLLKLSQCSWVPHGSAWFCVRSSSQGQMVSDLRLWPPAELDPLQLQAL